MTSWSLDREGYITHYLVSGPLDTAYSSEERDPNQLRYEARLRSLIPRHLPVPDPEVADFSAPGRLGLPWRYIGGPDASFVNLSDFYSTMRRVVFDAVTCLLSDRAREVSAVIWSYAAVDLYCNGRLLGGIAEPVYKPIRRQEITLPLREGRNTLFLSCETLGVRDTRSVVALQLPSRPAGVRVTLPSGEYAQLLAPAREILDTANLTETALILAAPAPEGCRISFPEYIIDFADTKKEKEYTDVSGLSKIPLQEDRENVLLEIPTPLGPVSRFFERTERILPRLVRPIPSREENLKLVFRRIADVESESRGEKFGFPISNMLARKALGEPSRDDDRLMEEMLDLIETRVDCSDFLVCGLLRYLKKYPLPEHTAARVREALLNWRYWMDMDGFDGMCFWSENHCLMFYTCALLAGKMYPEDYFPLARRNGRELSAWGESRVLSWLSDVEKYGFEEFQSTVYTCVTFVALLNVVDFTEEAISRRAKALTDLMLRQLALHTFRGGIVAPQGRVYRGALYPFRAGAMALMNLADPSLPWDFGEGWLGFYATSTYTFPEDLKQLMNDPVSLSYTTGNARVILEKHPDWCLTSVQSPREPFVRWPNIIRNPDADPSSHDFVKSYNECFHGTTCFQPGVCGYQQHLWYAALSGEAALFINHPGSASEGGDMRPGYWHGNGVFPALKQEGNVLGMIYRIPASQPLHYIHLYCPECRFDEVRRDGSWLLLRKDRGFIGLWTSTPMEKWNGWNFRCEERMWGSETACLCVCAGRETESMEAFRRKVISLHPAYDPASGVLTASSFSLSWVEGRDDTQFL